MGSGRGLSGAYDPNTYEAEFEGHRILIVKTPQGKGYCPVDLIEQGRIDEAARLAARAFARNL